MTTDTEDGTTWGFPTHLRAEGHGYLTVCGAFVTGVKDRITDEPAASTCRCCNSHGPAAAWVELPDGVLIERRGTSIDYCEYAVAGWQPRKSDPRWVLRYWAKDEAEARFLAGQLSRYATVKPRILEVRHAGSALG